MQKLIQAFLTVLGGFIAFVGLILLINAPWAGASLIASALLIMPPVRTAVGAKTGITIPKNVRALALIVLFFATIGFMLKSGSASIARAEAERAALQARAAEERGKQDAVYFAANTDAVISEVGGAIDRNEFRKAMDIAEKYLPYGSPKLAELHSSAKSSLEACTDVYRTNQGWLVGCDYRGKNAFGA